MRAQNQPGEHSLLLTGDIEEKAEALLLNRDRDWVAASAMLVPHHGSLTSSSVGFISAVALEIAIISSGYRNRFDLPKQTVVQRYLDMCARVFNTAETSALRLRFVPGSRTKSHLHRRDEHNHWHMRFSPYSRVPDCSS